MLRRVVPALFALSRRSLAALVGKPTVVGKPTLVAVVCLVAACGPGSPTGDRGGQPRVEEFEYTDDDGNVWETVFTYDDSGALVEQEQTGRFGGKVTWDYEWEDGVLVKIEQNSGGDQQEVDLSWENGVLVGADYANSDNDIEFKYDDSGRLEELDFDDSQDYEVRFDDDTGQMTDLETPIGDYEYDYDNDDGKLKDIEVTLFVTQQIDVDYDSDGRIERLDQAGNDIDFTYDDNGMMLEIEQGDTTVEIKYGEGTASQALLSPPIGGFGIAQLIDFSGQTWSEIRADQVILLLE